jgi:hypothetical protein
VAQSLRDVLVEHALCAQRRGQRDREQVNSEQHVPSDHLQLPSREARLGGSLRF